MAKRQRRAYGRNYKVDLEGKPFVDRQYVGRLKREKESWKDRMRDSDVGFYSEAFLDDEGIQRQLHIKNLRGTFLKGKCIYKIRKIKSPYLGVFRGYRIVVAWPNMAGHKPFKSDKAPSFEKPYLLVSFGDYEDEEALQKVLPKVPQEMKRRGFNECLLLETSKQEQEDEADEYAHIPHKVFDQAEEDLMSSDAKFKKAGQEKS
jgi:hypothetical protein